jgi:hypothetical protein
MTALEVGAMHEPNLRRIPGDGDRVAESILLRMPTPVDARFIESLTAADRLALGRYGARMASVALRRRSPELLGTALLASGSSARPRDDARDLIAGVCLHFVVAERLAMRPADLFAEVADRLPEGPVSDAIRQFGVRRDVTLKAFGWQLVDTDDGPDFCPA